MAAGSLKDNVDGSATANFRIRDLITQATSVVQATVEPVLDENNGLPKSLLAMNTFLPCEWEDTNMWPAFYSLLKTMGLRADGTLAAKEVAPILLAISANFPMAKRIRTAGTNEGVTLTTPKAANKKQ